jgi:twitching motility protein PilU
MNLKALLKLMVEKKASDLFLTSKAPVKIKIEGRILPVNKQDLTAEAVRQAAISIMTPTRSITSRKSWSSISP